MSEVAGDIRTEWHRQGASIPEVLAAMDESRKRFAREEVGDDDHPHPRSCVMTLVAVATDDEEEHKAHTAALRIAQHHPTQVIVVREQSGMPGSRVDAWIRTDVQRPKEGCATQCELVTLHVRGAAGKHLATIVDPMLVSGVPTYLWWVGTPAFGKRELEDALPICDALIVDSARFAEPAHGFRGLAKLTTTAHRQLGVGDFQWSRLATWREMVAQFFAPGDRRAFLEGISEVGIDYAGDLHGNRIGAALATGWLASSLGWKARHTAAGAGGSAAVRFSSAQSRSVEVRLRAVDRPAAAGTVTAMRLAGAAGGSTFRLSVELDPPRHRARDLAGFHSLHPTGADDEAALELASRRAERHRSVLHRQLDSLHHTVSGEPPGESRPRHPRVLRNERRRAPASQVLLTLIQIGEGAPLRHLQQVEREDEAALLLELLTGGTRDAVFQRSLAAATGLVHPV